MTNETEPVESAEAEYMVVLRARSAARFLPEGGCELNLTAAAGLGLGPLRIRTFTRWVGDGDQSIPRELVVEVRGRAASLDEAIVKFSTVARPIATLAGFVANVPVGSVEVHLAYECTPDRTERQFLETFLPDEAGGVPEGRILNQDLMIEVCAAFHEIPEDHPRISRALLQYELALREWRLGGEWLALSHLYIAVETLTKAVTRKVAADSGITEQELAESFGVVTDDPERPRWKQVLGEQARLRVIFEGDTDTYKTAKAASDGIEHGFLEFDQVVAHALKCTDKTFEYVRRTILGFFALPMDITDKLMAIKPKDVQSRRKVLRGRLLGAAEDPSAGGALYPVMEWRSSIGSVVREGSVFHLHDRDQITVHTHPDIRFQLDRVELHGRLEDGQVPVELTDSDVGISYTPGPQVKELLAAVPPLITAATGRTETMVRGAAVYAFNLFGQGVAYFEAAQMLTNDQRPVEALSALRGLVLIAASFERIVEEDGSGLGVAVRMVLDGLDRSGVDPDAIDQRREAVLRVAASEGISVPDSSPDPSTTAIHTSLNVEMQLAEQVTNNPIAAVGLHLKQSDPEHLGFHTRMEPGDFTDMVGSAVVMAILDLIKVAATFFGWTVDAEQIDMLLESARSMNERAANPPPASDLPQA